MPLITNDNQPVINAPLKSFGPRLKLRIYGPMTPFQFEQAYNTSTLKIKATTPVQAETLGEFYYHVYYEE